MEKDVVPRLVPLLAFLETLIIESSNTTSDVTKSDIFFKGPKTCVHFTKIDILVVNDWFSLNTARLNNNHSHY